MQRARLILVVVLFMVTSGCANVRSMQDGWSGRKPKPAPHHHPVARPTPARPSAEPASAATLEQQPAAPKEDEAAASPTAPPPPAEAKPPAEPALYDPF
jgi:hypothetical protein